MKVCYVITRAETGGAQFHVRDLCLKLKENGHFPYLIVGDNDVLVSQLEKEDIPVFIMKNMAREISPIKDLLGVIELRRLIKKISPDIVTLHSSKAGVLGRLGLIGTGIPVLFTVHGWAFTEGISVNKRRLYVLIEKICSKFCRKIITVSAYDKKIALNEKVADYDKQVVIHNGIPKLTSINEKREKSEQVTIINVARFAEQKDHETLIHALAECKDLNWSLKLVGKGETMAQIQKLINEYDLKHRVSLLGERDDVDDLLAKSDIFTLISNWEGFPISILEAMRAGLPVIASDVGGVKEAIVDGDNGFLVERKNISQLAQKLRVLIEDRQLAEKMALNGRKKFVSEFTFQIMYEKTFEQYQLACKKSL